MIEHELVAVAAWTAIAQGEAAPPMAGAPVGGESQAQPGVGAGTGGGTGGGQGGGGFDMLIFIIPLLLFMVVMMLSTSRRQGKERKQREAMLSGLRRNDRVQTTGGMLGKIVEVKGEEVVLKVDDSNNTRIRFSKAAIQQVVKQAAGEPAQDSDAD